MIFTFGILLFSVCRFDCRQYIVILFFKWNVTACFKQPASMRWSHSICFCFYWYFCMNFSRYFFLSPRCIWIFLSRGYVNNKCSALACILAPWAKAPYIIDCIRCCVKKGFSLTLIIHIWFMMSLFAMWAIILDIERFSSSSSTLY